jgi:hypothetical protein
MIIGYIDRVKYIYSFEQMNKIVNCNTFKLNRKFEFHIMSIQDRDEAADREFAKSLAGQNLPNPTEGVSLQISNETKESTERDRTAETTLVDKSKDFKDHPMPSFQEMDTRDTTLASTSTKIEELKADSIAIAEQTIVRSKDDVDRESSTSQS